MKQNWKTQKTMMMEKKMFVMKEDIRTKGGKQDSVGNNM